MGRAPRPCLCLVGMLVLLACDRAGEAATGAPPAAAETTVATTPLDSLVARGEELYYEGAFDEARAVWRSARDRAAVVQPALEPHILMWLGLAAWKQADYAEARRLGELALQLKRQRGLTGEISRSLNALGLVAWHEARFEEAAALFDSAAAAAHAMQDDAGVQRARANHGLVLADLGRFDAAAASLRDVRRAARTLGDARLEGNAATNLAMVLIRQGAPQAALAELSEARAIYDELAYDAGRLNLLGQAAAAWSELGEPALALAALDSALALARTLELPEDEASTSLLVGSQYAFIGDHDRALRFLAAAHDLAERHGLKLHGATADRGSAVVQARLGNLQLARTSALEALETHRALATRHEELLDLLLLAEIDDAAGDAAGAARWLDTARRLSAELETASAATSTALTQARLAARAGNADRILGALSLDDATLARAGAAAEWEVLALRARAHALAGDTAAAAVAGVAALRAVERVRSGLQPGPLRSLYGSDRATVYADLTLNLLRLGRAHDAFDVADAARGRGLIEHLASTPSRTGTLQDVAEAERLLRHIDDLVSQLAEHDEAPALQRSGARTAASALATRLAAARTEYETLLLRAGRASPRTAAILSLPGGARADAVGRTLADGELLLQYLVTPGRLLVFAMRRGGLAVLEVPVPEEQLANRVRLARDILARPAGAGEPAVLVSLHDVLVRPVVDAGLFAGTQHVIVVPHRALSYLPFAALVDRRTGRYLVEDVALSSLPSAAALPALRQPSGTPASGTPAGAQVQRAASGTVSAFAPLPTELPETRQEVAQVRRYRRLARLWVGSRADEPAVRRALERGDVVHVATHGIMNAGNPMFSRIQLARGGSADPRDDGRLEVHELLQLSIRSPLVFLSGCETGSGAGWYTDYSRRDDFATLAQAFLFAGARSVVATLWPIEDRGAAVFASSFYRSLRGTGAAAALAAAQRAMLRDPRHADPYYWAGYTVHGLPR